MIIFTVNCSFYVCKLIYYDDVIFTLLNFTFYTLSGPFYLPFKHFLIKTGLFFFFFLLRSQFWRDFGDFAMDIQISWLWQLWKFGRAIAITAHIHHWMLMAWKVHMLNGYRGFFFLLPRISIKKVGLWIVSWTQQIHKGQKPATERWFIKDLNMHRIHDRNMIRCRSVCGRYHTSPGG